MRTSKKSEAVAKAVAPKPRASRKVLAHKSKLPARKKKLATPRGVVHKRKGQKGSNSPSRADVFVAEYLVDLNGRQAAIRAGYSPASARTTAAELLASAPVHEALTKAMVERARRTAITADKVLERLWGIATADPREVVELYRGCCRYCWGEGNRYQYTPAEMREARQAYALIAERDEHGAIRTPFDERGGLGYDARKDPNPACHECFGQGVERVFPKDTRDLSPCARLLYAGVKTTQHGIEIKTHDQKSALVDVGKHLGMFRERVELTGKDGAPLEAGVVVVPAKQLAAPHEAPDVPVDVADKVPPPLPAPKPFKVRGSGR